MPDHHQVRFGKVTFTKLPDIDNIPVQDKHFGLNASQVMQQFPGMTSKCTEMNIGDDNQVNFTFGYWVLFHMKAAKISGWINSYVNSLLRKH
jgi:hypothetical protein